nr:MAG TPA: hypothetical protein [Caudoviricetes sp.]
MRLLFLFTTFRYKLFTNDFVYNIWFSIFATHKDRVFTLEQLNRSSIL